MQAGQIKLGERPLLLWDIGTACCLLPLTPKSLGDIQRKQSRSQCLSKHLFIFYFLCCYTINASAYWTKQSNETIQLGIVSLGQQQLLMLSVKTSSAGIWSGILSKHHPVDVHPARNINTKMSNLEGPLIFTFTSERRGRSSWTEPPLLDFAWLLFTVIIQFGPLKEGVAILFHDVCIQDSVH